MSILNNTETQEIRAQRASLFDNDSDNNRDDYFDQIQEEAETELLRHGVGARRTILSDERSW